MYLTVDRIENHTVLLQDDHETSYTLSVHDYESLVGRPPRESDVMEATTCDGIVIAASPADEERDRRLARAEERLRRLMGQ